MDKRNNSGQILIVAILIIALTLLSTELYIYELGETIGETNSNSISDSIFAIKLGSQHVVVGSLANISIGGANQILATNLERWSSFVWRRCQCRRNLLNFTVRDTSPYSSGIWINRSRTDGVGISSSYANFTLELSDRGIDINQTYAINITTTLLIQGACRVIEGSNKQVNVTSNLLNDGNPALAKNLTLCYNNSSDWIVPGPQNNYILMDYGNGTYFMSFVADIPSENVEVSMHVYDQREIYVQTNVTCTEVWVFDV